MKDRTRELAVLADHVARRHCHEFENLVALITLSGEDDPNGMGWESYDMWRNGADRGEFLYDAVMRGLICDNMKAVLVKKVERHGGLPALKKDRQLAGRVYCWIREQADEHDDPWAKTQLSTAMRIFDKLGYVSDPLTKRRWDNGSGFDYFPKCSGSEFKPPVHDVMYRLRRKQNRTMYKAILDLLKNNYGMSKRVDLGDYGTVNEHFPDKDSYLYDRDGDASHYVHQVGTKYFTLYSFPDSVKEIDDCTLPYYRSDKRYSYDNTSSPIVHSMFVNERYYREIFKTGKWRFRDKNRKARLIVDIKGVTERNCVKALCVYRRGSSYRTEEKWRVLYQRMNKHGKFVLVDEKGWTYQDEGEVRVNREWTVRDDGFITWKGGK